jgi:DNA repair protein RadA
MIVLWKLRMETMRKDSQHLLSHITIIYHYRAECAGRSKLPEKIQRLNKYMHLLLKTAYSNAVAVVVTNHQTQSSVDGTYNRVAPLGGNVMSYASKYRIHLDYRGRYRRARLDIGPCLPQDDISFAINERGFTDVPEDNHLTTGRINNNRK